MVHARNKGKEGEREFCNRFQMFFPNELKRNLLQTREGGADISGCAPFQIEVKRCQKLELPRWWRQVNAACQQSEIPVVAYRQNHAPWRFLLPSRLLDIECQSYVEAAEEVFVRLVLKTYEGEAGGPLPAICSRS